MAYKIPKDPNMLYSYINVMLRDRYASLEDFCDANDADMEEIVQRLEGAGFVYNAEINQFR